MTFTASAYHRVLRCPASAALPQINTTSVYAETGNTGHEWLNRYVEAVRACTAIDVPDEWRPLCEAVTDIAPHLRSEIAFAYNVATGEGRILGQNIGRAYRLEPMEIAGTADLAGLTEEGVVVIDAKTGPGEVTPAAHNQQLRILALMAARHWGRDSALVSVLRCKELGTPYWDLHHLDVFDLDETADQVRRAYAAVSLAVVDVRAGRVPNVTEGAHCKYCPATPVCPAKTALIRRLADGSEAAELELLKPMTPETAGLAWRKLQAAKHLLRNIEAAVMACLDERGELPLPDGAVLMKVIGEGNEKLDGDVVWQVLADIADRELADEAVERRATKKQLGEALRKRYGRKGAETERKVLDEVRKRGGSERGTTTKIEEVPAERRLAR